jgi:hypothetical protein
MMNVVNIKLDMKQQRGRNPSKYLSESDTNRPITRTEKLTILQTKPSTESFSYLKLDKKHILRTDLLEPRSSSEVSTACESRDFAGFSMPYLL